MPSPFPGMDPYLEGSSWTSVHTQLGVEIQRQLMPLLRPKYIALTTERFVITTTSSDPDADASRKTDIYPDVSVGATGRSGTTAGRGTALLAPLQLVTVMPVAIPHVSVEIRDVSERRLVTDIKILSPTNKRGDGRLEYLVRRERLLLSAAHLVEIDLLRTGQRVPMHERLPDDPYFVFVSRVEKRPLTDIWPIALDANLPPIPVPLLSGDADVTLDLQRVLTNVYDLAGFDAAIDYTRPPEVKLSARDAAWAQERLQEYKKAQPAAD